MDENYRIPHMALRLPRRYQLMQTTLTDEQTARLIHVLTVCVKNFISVIKKKRKYVLLASSVKTMVTPIARMFFFKGKRPCDGIYNFSPIGHISSCGSIKSIVDKLSLNFTEEISEISDSKELESLILRVTNYLVREVVEQKMCQLKENYGSYLTSHNLMEEISEAVYKGTCKELFGEDFTDHFERSNEELEIGIPKELTDINAEQLMRLFEQMRKHGVFRLDNASDGEFSFSLDDDENPF